MIARDNTAKVKAVEKANERIEIDIRKAVRILTAATKKADQAKRREEREEARQAREAARAEAAAMVATSAIALIDPELR
jgi:hypothetical protein